MTTPQRYPLAWPLGWERTRRAEQQRSRWSRRDSSTGPGYYSPLRPLTVSQALGRLLEEFGRLGRSVRDSVVVSSNIRTRLDGLPYSNTSEPADPGVAVYFTLRGKPRCLACDRYRTVSGNIAAIAAHVEAIRAIERYGVGTIDQAFAGYVAIPERSSGGTWADVLGSPETLDACRAAYRRLALERHPDKPTGSHEAMAQLTEAMRDAEAFFRGQQS